MKKLILFCAVLGLLAGCATTPKAKKFANCRYKISGIEISEYNVNSLAFVMYLSITNVSKRNEANLKKLEAKLSMNDVEVSDVLLENVKIKPNATKTKKVPVTVPMNAFGTNLLGLVSMGSATVDYHLEGNAVFDTPQGDEVVPIDIGRRGSNN